MHKIVKIILVVLGVIGAVLWFQLPSSDVPASEAVDSGAMNFMFIITYLLLAIAILFSLVFSLVALFSNPQSLKRTLIVVVGFLVVVGIAYGISSGTDVNIDEMARRGVATDESTVKLIGMGLNVFFLLTIIAVGAMLWGGVRKMTK
ncbi:hypothetical protein PP178_01525 [Zeaxanthinibacter sp. PT1]|uniref:hypothetical protein n=1 Tax=Zeaxanthinibacter TaxID=561554 RepID=UPI0018453B23|nr:hypothetical protein [Zeaxanthinibacter sp. PT1]MDC6350218.1 hypothetical protein [Zeaxanthinibacter sp. PT1]NNF19843.1 hypothetical protein [Flavobacteriaceae bacterium]